MAEATADEVRSLARLAFSEVGGAAAGLYGFHRAIATRAFRASGPAALPVRAVHDAIAARAYAGVGGGFRLAGAAADAGLRRRRVRDGRALSSSPRGALVVGALTGLIGDTLEQEGNGLHEAISVRAGGRAVPPEPADLAAAFPQPTGLLVVFLHGLMETEFAWRLGGGETYGARLSREHGYTPLELRYNTGRHISENGRDLADLLQRVVAAWPVEVERVALVGHSMGGLVARSACHQAALDGQRWVRRVRHVVSLGSPHMGAPLAQGVHWISAALHALPETRPIAAVLRRRSAGIRDLRQGSLVDADWRDRDPDVLRATACEEVPLLEGATHCFVAATITAEPRHPLGRLIGDALVLEASASGRSRTRRIPFESEHGLVLGGTHHIALLNHPAVYERLREWLDPQGGAPAA
jgi:pimeloyl-ACP methyl ester carboxylesterase